MLSIDAVILAEDSEFHSKTSERLPQIPGWCLTSRLSSGPLTEVFRARPEMAAPEQGASYVIKRPYENHEDDPAALDALARESIVGRSVSHPHLLPVLEVHWNPLPPWLVLPYLPGSSLAEVLSSGARLSLPSALWIARQISKALDALHTAGWMHGDIKPQNIMIGFSGHATLIDFGFTRRLGDRSPLDRQPLRGTPSYMAPETITSRLSSDIRADIYSLGIVLFEMLTGRVPFSASDAARLAVQHREDLPSDLREITPHIPIGVAQLVRSTLAKDPLRRPQTPADLVEQFTSLEIETFSQRIVA